MLTSLIAYVVGFLVCVLALGPEKYEYCSATFKGRCRMVLGTIVVSLLWPAAGVWFLWELFDVWRTSMRDRKEGEKYD